MIPEIGTLWRTDSGDVWRVSRHTGPAADRHEAFMLVLEPRRTPARDEEIRICQEQDRQYPQLLRGFQIEYRRNLAVEPAWFRSRKQVRD